MKLPILLAAAVLAGCAAPEPQPLPVLTPEFAQQMPAADLCLGLSTFRPGNAAVAQQEIARRGINCQDHTAAMQAIQQRRAQAAAILLQQRAAQPAYQPIPMPQLTWPQIQPNLRPTTVCTTERIGSQLQTVCR